MIEVGVHLEELTITNLSCTDRLLILRSQLTLLRTRAERGIPISIESLARAESLARTLEIYKAGE